MDRQHDMMQGAQGQAQVDNPKYDNIEKIFKEVGKTIIQWLGKTAQYPLTWKVDKARLFQVW